MPVLNPQATGGSGWTNQRRAARTFPVCSNPHCASGWLHLWRKRGVPVIEGGWLCSSACTRARVEDLLRRERVEVAPVAAHRHRIPIGLLLLEQGWITREQLKDALEAQRDGAGTRLGEWLVANRGLAEGRLTHALGLQWSCPVFSLEKHGGALPVTAVPRILAESFGFVPLRLAASGILYLAFEDRIDHSLALAIERVTRLRVECGLLNGSEFRVAEERYRQGRFARVRMIEAGSSGLLAEAFANEIEKAKPFEGRLVRLHDLFWLRLWTQPGGSGEAEDVIGSVARFG